MEQRIQIVVALMKDNLCQEVPLEEVAQRLNLSASRLRHLFKAETGMTPAQYCKALKMEKAKELIETTFLNMKEIMGRVGIKNKNSFIRDFKKINGLTPTRYREQHLKNYGGEAIAKTVAK
jgi:transcriptional regulator GlxA family with amidase domain